MGRSFHSYEEIISNGSESLKLRATVKLAGLLNCVPKHFLLLTVPILIGLLEGTSSDPGPLQEVAAYCLKCITCNEDPELLTLICGPRTLASLVKILKQSDGRCQRFLIKSLWGVVTSVKDSRLHTFSSGGLEVVVDMLTSYTDSRRRYLLETLSALALVREVRRALVCRGELTLLIEAAKCGSMVSRERAAQALGLLGVTKRARRTLVALGAIPALADLLRDGDFSTKVVAGNALGVISSHVDYIRPVAQAGVIPLYAELLRGPEPLGMEVAEDVFCVLAVAEGNAVEISEHLVRILQEDNAEAKAAAADVLWDLSGYQHSISVIGNSGAIPVLVDLLRDGSSDIREKVSGAIAQLSYHEADRTALADAGAILCLIDLLQDDSEELRDNAAETLINFSEDPSHHERLSEAFAMPAFQSMQDRMVHIRAADQHMVRSLRHMSIEQLTRDPVFD
ncbi:U-box domain-containing protein 13 [Bienertia sinuspersici]